MVPAREQITHVNFGFGDDGNMTAELARFDLTREIADSVQRKPWPSGIHARTLYKKSDFRVVLICMEAAARMKEHHVEGAYSVWCVRGGAPSAKRGSHYSWRFDQA
jgi:hypothetical protein